MIPLSRAAVRDADVSNSVLDSKNIKGNDVVDYQVTSPSTPGVIAEIVGKGCHHSVRRQGRELQTVVRPIRQLWDPMVCNQVGNYRRVLLTGGG